MWLAQTQQTGSKGGYAMRQDETYWREGFNFDFETDDGKEISHNFDFIEVCGDNILSVRGAFFVDWQRRG